MEAIHKNDKNWHGVFSVQNISLVNARCEVCKKSVRHGLLALQESCFNIRHRGNETQYYHIYHRECSGENVEWAKWDEEQIRKDKIFAQIKLLQIEKNKIKKLISKLENQL